jgi:hypothetical protein
MKKFLLSVVPLGFLLFTQQVQAQVTWNNVPGPYGGVVFDLEFSATGNKYYALISENNFSYPFGNLYSSVDNGATWQHISFSPDKEVATDVEVDNTGIYVVSFAGVYKSTDGGSTFTKLNTSSLSILRVKRNPVTGTLIGAGHDKLWRSTDGGATWTLGYSTPSPGAGAIQDIEVNSIGASGQIFVSGGVGLVRSTDDGFSATSVTTGLSDIQIEDIEMSTNGATLFAHHRLGIQQAVDPAGAPLMGDTWTTITGVSDASFNLKGVLAASSDGNIIFADNLNNVVYSKTNASSDWGTAKGTLNANMLCAAARNVNSFFIGAEEGMFSTSSGGSAFITSNTGIEAVRFQSMVLTPSGTVVVSAGDKLHSSFNLFASNPTWQTFYFNEFQYTPDLFLMADGSVLALGSVGLRSNTDVDNWPNTYTTPANTYVYATTNGTAFYGVSDAGKLFYSANSGATWNTAANVSITGLPTSYIAQELATSGTNNKLFLKLINSNTSTNELYRITYSPTASAPTSATAALVSTAGFSGYTVNEADDVKALGNTVYVLGPGSSSHRLAQSSDGGTTWTTRNVPGGNKLSVTSNGYIFILQSNTFYVSRDNGISFSPYTFNNDTNEPFDLAGLSLDSEGRAFLVQNFSGGLFYSDETLVLPPAPTNFQLAGRSNNEVTLRWTDNSTNEFRYIIEREGTNGYDSIGYTGGVSLSGKKDYFQNKGLQPSTTYNYRVRAVNSAGYSNYATVSVTTTGVCTSTIPDNRSWSALLVEGGGSPISNARVVSLGSGSYSLDDVTLGALSSTVNINESTISGFFYESCGESYLHRSNQGYLRANTNGSWNGTNLLTLKWITAGNYIEISKTLQLTLNASDPTPASPSSVSASILNNTTMEVRWVGSAFETEYLIERSNSSGTGFVQIGTVSYPAKTYLDNTIVLNSNYYYRVRAKNTTGTSAPSAESTVVNFKHPNFILATNAVTSTPGNTLGVVWGDFDNDNDDDLLLTPFNFLSTSLNTPYVFRNDGGGVFTTISPGFAPSNYASGTAGDYNNDGNLDIYFTVFEGQNKLYRGVGNFTFTEITGTPVNVASRDIGGSSFSPMWVDYNNDGRLDLFVVYEGSVNLLFKQNADGTFTQQTTGEIVTSTFFGLDASWVDFDNDGDMDVFFVNGRDSNLSIENPPLLYKNNGDGTFTSLVSTGFDLSSSSNDLISAAWGDYNNDGFLDVFVANQDAEPTSTNYLYKNNGNGTFTKQTSSLVMEIQTAPSFGGTWGDVNNDGLLDLLVSKGGKNVTYLNQGTTFTKVTNEKFNDPFYFNLGIALSDYDKDGLLDIAIGNVDPNIFSESGRQQESLPPTNLLFENNNTAGNWVQLKLVGTTSNKGAVGARVKVRTGASTDQYRQVLAHTSIASQNSSLLHVGLGANSSITLIEVKWPSGIIQTLQNVSANQTLTITEAGAPPVINFTAVPTINKGQALTLNIEATDNSEEALTTVLHYRKIAASSYSTLNGTANGSTTDQYNFTAPASFFDETGMEYYFTATNPAGNLARSPAGTATYKTLLVYSDADARIPNARIGTGGGKNDWKIFAVPFELGSNNGVSTVLDELTSLENKKDFRLITYKNTQAWAEYPSSDLSTIVRGQGYFFNIKTVPSTGLSVGSGLTAPDNDRSNLFQLTLKQGWNQIGNPYLTSISWNDVKNYSANTGLTGTGTILKTYAGGSYVNATTLQPFEGGFVLAENDITISIPFSGQTAVGRSSEIAFAEGDWVLPLTLKQNDIENTFGGIGMHSKAHTSYDQFDDINAPRFFNYIEMSSPHPEHIAKRFARDIVPTQDKFTWDFTVDSNVEGTATLAWEYASVKNHISELYLFDVALQRPVDMSTVSSYSFNPKESSRFKVYYGADVFRELLPKEVQLSQAYPNPTEGKVVVAFYLPDAGGNAQKVEVEMLDALGRFVGVMGRGIYAAGYHELAWDGTNFVNGQGLYTYRLNVTNNQGRKVLQGKIMVKK